MIVFCLSRLLATASEGRGERTARDPKQKTVDEFVHPEAHRKPETITFEAKVKLVKIFDFPLRVFRKSLKICKQPVLTYGTGIVCSLIKIFKMTKK